MLLGSNLLNAGWRRCITSWLTFCSWFITENTYHSPCALNFSGIALYPKKGQEYSWSPHCILPYIQIKQKYFTITTSKSSFQWIAPDEAPSTTLTSAIILLIMFILLFLFLWNVSMKVLKMSRLHHRVFNCSTMCSFYSCHVWKFIQCHVVDSYIVLLILLPIK